jgi:iron complex transport system substrate-binding protein
MSALRMRQAAIGALLWAAAGLAFAAPPKRVVTLGGAVTEIVYALGAGERLVGTDNSSNYPSQARQLPQVGYYRGFSIEGVASLQPDLVLASEQAGPPAAVEQLRKLGQKVVMLPAAPTVEALEQRITGVAAALDTKDAGDQLVQQIRTQVAVAAQAAAQAARNGAAPRVLLVSSHTGKLEGAGTETAADAVLRLAGATNVLSGEKGYKAISGEGAAALRPDVIVTTTMSIAALGGLDAFAAQPGLAATPAARARRIIVMDDLLLLGFGPRLPEALRQLQAGFAARP